MAKAKKKPAAKKPANANKAAKAVKGQQPYLDSSLAPKHAAELEPLMQEFDNSRKEYAAAGKAAKEQKQRIRERMQGLKVPIYKYQPAGADYHIVFTPDTTEDLKVEKKKGSLEPVGQGGRVGQ